MNQYKGECLCGTCRYVITGEAPKAMFLCHCSRCKKETGTIHGVNVFFNDASLSWEKGENNISFFHLKDTRNLALKKPIWPKRFTPILLQV